MTSEQLDIPQPVRTWDDDQAVLRKAVELLMQMDTLLDFGTAWTVGELVLDPTGINDAMDAAAAFLRAHPDLLSQEVRE